MKFQSKEHYLAVPVVLLIGFFVGIFFPVVIYYHQWWSETFVGTLKDYSISFFFGVLGATCQMSIGFAREINALVTNPSKAHLPTYYEGFGYLLKQLWGGIAAVIFVLAVKQGFLAAFEKNQGPMELEAIIVISFVVGLRAFKILTRIAGIIK